LVNLCELIHYSRNVAIHGEPFDFVRGDGQVNS